MILLLLSAVWVAKSTERNVPTFELSLSFSAVTWKPFLLPPPEFVIVISYTVLKWYPVTGMFVVIVILLLFAVPEWHCVQLFPPSPGEPESALPFPDE